MIAVVQRVDEASVTVDNETVGKIDKGFLVLFGVRQGDSEAEAELIADKMCGLRIFEDENEKMNLSLADVGEVFWLFPSLRFWRTAPMEDVPASSMPKLLNEPMSSTGIL